MRRVLGLVQAQRILILCANFDTVRPLSFSVAEAYDCATLRSENSGYPSIDCACTIELRAGYSAQCTQATDGPLRRTQRCIGCRLEITGDGRSLRKIRNRALDRCGGWNRAR